MRGMMLVASLALSGCATAQTCPDGSPARAASGKMVIECDVTIEGRLLHCAIVDDPFGDSELRKLALDQASRQTLMPRDRNGNPATGRVRFPISFDNLDQCRVDR